MWIRVSGNCDLPTNLFRKTWLSLRPLGSEIPQRFTSNVLNLTLGYYYLSTVIIGAILVQINYRKFEQILKAILNKKLKML